jgi:hypothetical protein
MGFIPDSSMLQVNNDNFNMAIPTIYGATAMLREIKAIEPEMYKSLRKELITEIKPLYAAIKSNIPVSSPTSDRMGKGFNHGGRTSWTATKVTVTGKVDLRQKAGRRGLVTVRTSSAAVEIADMAGRRGKVQFGGQSKEYRKGNVFMTHTLNGQGASMIKALGGKPSRYVYPAVERMKPFVTRNVESIILKYSELKNIKLRIENRVQ